MGNGLAAFAAGFGTGYMNQTRQNKLDAERQEDRGMVKQDHEDKVKERDRVERDRNEMSEAGKFATVNQDAVTVDGLSAKPVLYESADVAASDTRQARMARDAAKERYGVNPTNANTPDGSDPSASPDRPQIPETTTKQAISVNGKQYGSTVEADLAAKNFNDGRTDRIANALYKQGRPDTAIGIQSSSMKLRDEQDAYGRRLKDEGVLDASKALRTGDGAAMKAAFNKGGQYKIDGNPVVTPEVREIPGFGKVTTYNAKFMIAGPDGQPREMNVNSHDISMQTMSYEKQYDAQLKAAKIQAEGELGQAHIRYYDKAGNAMETKAEAAGGREVDPLSLTDKATLKSINDRRGHTNTAILKGITDGADAKVMAAYAKQMAGLNMEESAMYAKYEGAKPGTADDGLGFRASQKPGGVTPKAGAGPGAATGSGTGRIGGNTGAAGQNDILQAEIVKSEAAIKKAGERLSTPGFDRPENAAEVTLVREEIARNTADVASARREVSRLKLPTSMTNRTREATPSAATAPTPAANAVPVSIPGRGVSGSLGNTSTAVTPSRSVAGVLTDPSATPEMAANDAGLAKRTISYAGLIDKVAATRGTAGGYRYKGKIYPTEQAAINALNQS